MYIILVNKTFLKFINTKLKTEHFVINQYDLKKIV